MPRATLRPREHGRMDDHEEVIQVSEFEIERAPALARAIRSRDPAAIRRSLETLEALGAYGRDEPEPGLIRWRPIRAEVADAA
jgi:hypothetical protein